jgi:hypothetical protein
VTSEDVHGNEMDGPHDFDDNTAEAFIAGLGREVDPHLADAVGDMRVAYASSPPVVGAELAALIGATEPAPLPSARRFERMRASMLAKIGAATAAVVAATGGLAVAGALPAPVQDAISHVGVGNGAHHSQKGTHGEPGAGVGETTSTVDPTATTVPGDTPTTADENHGGDVSDVAHDHSVDGCEHGHAVAQVASDGKSNGQPCNTTSTTIGDGTTPTSEGHGSDHGGGNDGGDGAHHGPPSSTPPVTNPHGGGNGGDHGNGGSGGNGGDHGGH